MPQAFIPYSIHHINLEKAKSLSSELVAARGNYMVFWWGVIPLGHLYLKPGERPTGEELTQKAFDSIFPAVTYYVRKTGGSFTSLDKPADLSFNKLESLFSSVIAAGEVDVSKTIDLSIVICTRDRAQYIQPCLSSLLSMPAKPKEIIVVDNAPTDNSTKDAVSKFPGVVYVTEPRPGLDIARNRGIKTATSEIVAYVDDDVMVHPLWSHQIYQSFKDENVGAATGLVFAAQLDTEAQMIFEKHWSFNRGYTEKIYTPKFLKKQPPPVWEIGAGANMAFRRSIFSATGLFDERLDAGAAGCNGDSEMWFRVLLKGFSIFYNPLAIVHHEHRSDMRGLKKQIFSYMRGFAAAALIQHRQHKQAGYKKHLMFRMPYYYLKLAGLGFPYYRLRFRTLYNEVAGVASGVVFYLKNRKRKGHEFIR